VVDHPLCIATHRPGFHRLGRRVYMTWGCVVEEVAVTRDMRLECVQGQGGRTSWAFAGVVSAIRHPSDTQKDGKGTYFELWPSPRPPRLIPCIPLSLCWLRRDGGTSCGCSFGYLESVF
jgi:hypothetical protein